MAQAGRPRTCSYSAQFLPHTCPSRHTVPLESHSCLPLTDNCYARILMARPVSHHDPYQSRDIVSRSRVSFREFYHKQPDLKKIKTDYLSLCISHIWHNRFPNCSRNSPHPLYPCPLSGQPSSHVSFSTSPTQISFFKSNRSDVVDSLWNESHSFPSEGHTFAFNVSCAFSEIYWISSVVPAKDFGFSKDKGFEVSFPWKIANCGPRAFKNNLINMVCVLR